jgi:hypothetical protein
VAGRTALTNATLSAIPVHTTIAVGLSPWAVKHIDKLPRAFIWCGDQTVGGGKCKVTWTTVCRPRDLGGLGVVDLRRAGVALRARWAWKQRVDHGHYATALPDNKEKLVLAIFSAATVSIVSSGESTHFWTDNWIEGRSIRALAPALFGAVAARRRNALVCEALPGRAWVRHVSGAFTLPVIAEFMFVWRMLRDIQLVPSSPNIFRWRFTADGSYSSASTYRAMFLGSSSPLGAKEIWKTSAPPKVRYFFWLVMHGRCWTAERRFKHGLQDSAVCIICDQSSETMDHLIIGCTFSREVWSILLSKLHLQDVLIIQEERALEWWLRSRKLLLKHLRKGFDSLFFLVGWSIWKEINARTFNDKANPPSRLAQLIQDEASEWCRAGFRSLLPLLGLL